MAHGEYKPIDAYGLIGNLETCALVGRDGAIDWCCLPNLQSPSIFAAILDSETGGTFRIQPTGSYDAVQRYQPDTNVLDTEFTTDAGALRLTDFMPILSDDPAAPFSEPWIFRRVECLEGSVEFEVTFEPRFDYARARTVIESMDNVLLARGSGEHVSLNTAFALEIDGISARGSTTSRLATPPGTPSSTASASDPSRSIPNSCSIGLADTGATGYTPVRNPGVRSRVSTTTR
jgi:GH15 family glucan-1,4-alpha-glucosidase